ncbi:MAG: lipoyl(octanoyl) transferase LipB [Deltaproteobacteria bacterium]|nr:lipoyl(octanoyl) transferase LipB [Deltaproteobacteria bacterium]
MQALEFKTLGITPYEDCWELQKQVHREVVEGRRPSIVLLVEHPCVITLGKHAKTGNILRTEQDLAQQGVKLLRVDRGGDVTAHEPGQLVVYPVLKLASFHLTPRRLVYLLEQSVIDLAAHFGLTACRLDQFPGVWVGNAKLAAVGIRIRERASYHGLSINIENTLKTFENIIPCGISAKNVCSLSSSLERPISVKEAIPPLLKSLKKNLILKFLKRGLGK